MLSACEIDYPPYCRVTPQGEADGFSVELLRAALKAMGRDVAFKTGQWSELKQDLAEGRIQALPVVGRTPEREAVFDFTFPYLPVHGTIIVRDSNTNIQSAADLKGRAVAVLKGDNAEEYLRRVDFGADIVPLPSFEVALRELSAGKHDAVVIQKLVAVQIMQQAGLRNLRSVGPPLKDFTQSLCFAVREGDRALLDVLNEGLAIVMADGTFRRLHAKWFAALEAEARARSRIIVGGDDNYPPYEFLDANGQPAGFNVDLTRAIARQLGLQVEIQLGTWAKIRKGLENGEIDILQGVFYSIERDEQFSFSLPHSIVQHSIVSREDAPAPSNLRALKDKSILVQNGDIMHDFAVRNGFEAGVVPLDTQEEALRQLAEGRHDAALVARYPALYWIQRRGWNGLRVSEFSVLPADYCYAVRHGQEALLALFDEGLAALKTTGEYRALQARWLAPYEPRRIPIRHVAWLLLGALGLAAVFAVLAALFQRQVHRRTAALRESEEKFRMAFHINPNIIAISRLSDGMYAAVNRSFTRLLGYAEEEVVGKTSTELGIWADPDGRRKFVEVLQAEGFVDEYEAPFRTRDGAIRQVLIAASIIAIRSEPHILHTARDITERKQDEEKLRKAEAEARNLLDEARRSRRALLSLVEDQKLAQDQLRALTVRQEALLSAIPDIIMEVDTDKVYTWANPAGLEFFGPDVVGREARYYFEGEQDTYKRVQPLFEGRGEVIYLESLQRRHDNQIRLLAWWCRVLKDREGRVTGALSTARDITEQRELEDQLRQAQKIDAVGRLAGGVAHDFNNMLGVILGHAEMALEQIKPSQPVYEDLREIQQAAQRSADLTRQLLAFARKQTVDPRILNLNDTIAGMLKMLRRLIGEDIELVWEPGPDLWPVRMDPVQVDQVLANLAVNARDAIRGVGQLSIRTENVILRESDLSSHADFIAGEYVLLKVSDNGAGMDQATMTHLFEPFFTTKGLGKGTGLGLATLYGAVKQNGGFIDVDSLPGRGTTFNIYLPRTMEDRTEASAADAQEAGGGTETVLFVEDSAPLVKLVTTLLNRRGYNVLAAGLPSTALDLVRQYPKPIHLLIADVIMPEMNGRDLAGRIRELRPDIRVLFISGYTADVIAPHGVLENGIDFLQKPVAGKRLLAKVREILDRPS